jgi:hypothetical protein
MFMPVDSRPQPESSEQEHTRLASQLPIAAACFFLAKNLSGFYVFVLV